jgi:hypothetical protein
MASVTCVVHPAACDAAVAATPSLNHNPLYIKLLIAVCLKSEITSFDEPNTEGELERAELHQSTICNQCLLCSVVQNLQ